MLITNKKRFSLARRLTVMLLGVSVLIQLVPQPVSAISITNFDPSDVLSDSVLHNTAAINAAEIQQTLQRYGQSCAGSLCLKNYSEGGKTAAQIIYDVSVGNGINPQVLLALLEAENSLITASSPQQHQLDTAFGISCMGVCVSTFSNQAMQAAQLLANPAQATYQSGQSVTLSYQQENTNCGTTSFTIANTATALVYSYPGFAEVPNAAALGAGMGQGDDCSSYGVRNFYIALNQWFGNLNLYDYTPMYRFWSDSYRGHFYTIDAAEKDRVIATWPGIWSYEGPKYSIPQQIETMCRGLPLVYRFWSDKYRGHFYTIDAAEKDRVIATWPGIWSYEGPKYCASTMQTKQTPDPVYRFWSDKYMHHFYTADPVEKDRVIATWPGIWSYEKIAYYVKR